MNYKSTKQSILILVISLFILSVILFGWQPSFIGLIVWVVIAQLVSLLISAMKKSNDH